MEEEASTSSKMSPKCLICDKEFCGTATMLRHMRNVHKEKTDDLTPRRSKILCCICPPDGDTYSCKNLVELRLHMENQHGIPFKIVKFNFKGTREFMDWKNKVERENDCHYVQASGVRRTVTSWTHYLYCSRSGFYRPKGFNKHALKSQGSSKINSTCPSYMCVVTHLDCQNTVDVEYVSTHVGHKAELGHLTLNETDRKLLASQIAQGTDLNSILHSVRSSHKGKLQRIHLTTKKDLLNIKKAYAKFNTKANEKNRRVETWVEQMNNMITEETAAEIDNGRHVVLYYDELGNLVKNEVDANVTVETVAEEVVDTSSEGNPIESEKDVMEKLRLQLLKDAEMAVKKIKQAETLGQLVDMQKIFATANSSLDSLLKKC